MQKSEKHEFTFFWQGKQSLSDFVAQKTGIIDDKVLFHRIVTVLRLKNNETFILFDRSIHIFCEIIEITKKNFRIAILKLEQNNIIQPQLTFLLPILKRDALYEAIYSLTEVGCTTIHLVNTQKSLHSYNDQKDIDRLQKICIAAAEQSKNFAFPLINKPASLAILLEQYDEQECIKLFFDPQGIPFLDSIRNNKTLTMPFVLLIGPEGDLTTQEKELVKHHAFLFTALTPTILRAQQAATIGAGLIRSLIP